MTAHADLITLSASRFEGDMEAALRAIKRYLHTDCASVYELTDADAEWALAAMRDGHIAMDAMAIMDNCPV